MKKKVPTNDNDVGLSNSVALSLGMKDTGLETENDRPSTVSRISAALFYSFSSFLIVIFNKFLLTKYKFPSFQVVGISQMVATIVVLYCAKLLRVISFPNFSRSTPRKIWPLPVIYIFNLLFGLGGTKKLSLPMFTVLRRFSILFTMIAEYLILGQSASLRIRIIVCCMILGAVIAALNDLAFDLVGYIFIFSNDVFTASYGVVTKQKINAKDLGKFGILFYNSAFMLFPAMCLAYYCGEFDKVRKFDSWDNPSFVLLFFVVSIMGFVLMYATLLCTAYNSALTTTIAGCVKNIFVTYVGIMYGSDYLFSWTNFIGLNISVVGSLFYAYFAFMENDGKKKLIGSSGEKSIFLGRS